MSPLLPTPGHTNKVWTLFFTAAQFLGYILLQHDCLDPNTHILYNKSNQAVPYLDPSYQGYHSCCVHQGNLDTKAAWHHLNPSLEDAIYLCFYSLFQICRLMAIECIAIWSERNTFVTLSFEPSQLFYSMGCCGVFSQVKFHCFPPTPAPSISLLPSFCTCWYYQNSGSF